MPVEEGNQPRKNLGRARHDLLGKQVIALGAEVADHPACLGDEQAAGRRIPGREAQFEEPVEATSGNIGEIECRSPGAAQPRGALHHDPHHRKVTIEHVELSERKAGPDQRFFNPDAFRDPDSPAIEIGTATARCGEELISRRVVYHCLGDHTFLHERDGHGVLRKP